MRTFTLQLLNNACFATPVIPGIWSALYAQKNFLVFRTSRARLTFYSIQKISSHPPAAGRRVRAVPVLPRLPRQPRGARAARVSVRDFVNFSLAVHDRDFARAAADREAARQRELWHALHPADGDGAVVRRYFFRVFAVRVRAAGAAEADREGHPSKK